MPKPRRDEFDLTKVEGRAALSTLRNRGADRAVEYNKKYAKTSGHKVFLNFIPTWTNGVPRVWISHDDIVPLKEEKEGKFIPFFKEGVQVVREESDEDIEDASPPSSQTMQIRESASAGTKEDKSLMRRICGHCCTGNDMDNLHPLSAWLKCGYKGCPSTNFHFHAVCHGVEIKKSQEKEFNKAYIRCKGHSKIGQPRITASEELSDDAFEPELTKKKSKPSTSKGLGSGSSGDRQAPKKKSTIKPSDDGNQVEVAQNYGELFEEQVPKKKKKSKLSFIQMSGSDDDFQDEPKKKVSSQNPDSSPLVSMTVMGNGQPVFHFNNSPPFESSPSQ